MASRNASIRREIASSIRTVLRQLKQRVSRLHKVAVPNDRAPVPVIALVAGTALARRVIDIGSVAVEIAASRHIVPASILIRACSETAALLWWTAERIERAIVSIDASGLREFVNRVLVGTRLEGSPFAAPSILSAIKAVNGDARYEGFHNYYECLCETAHPNFSGVMLSYASTRTDETVRFLRRRRSLSDIEFLALDAALRMSLEGLMKLQACVAQFCELEAEMKKKYGRSSLSGESRAT
jgi:hypothetical protein